MLVLYKVLSLYLFWQEQSTREFFAEGFFLWESALTWFSSSALTPYFLLSAFSIGIFYLFIYLFGRFILLSYKHTKKITYNIES